jgi:hypothetical protein
LNLRPPGPEPETALFWKSGKIRKLEAAASRRTKPPGRNRREVPRRRVPDLDISQALGILLVLPTRTFDGIGIDLPMCGGRLRSRIRSN